MLGCLPWSEGRALYTGCFMRYSDTNFLNAISTGGGSSSRGKVIVIVIVVVSSVVVLGVAAFIGFVVWKNKLIQSKRKAEGLVYLHENTKTRIIHRDIKVSNILLDLRLRAKIADFGLARSFQEGKSHISTAIAGTFGYMAPEYLAYGQLTQKTDVYSFGVLLFEIVTGRQNNKRQNAEYTVSLVSEVWEHFQLGIVEELFDRNLMLHNCHTINVKNEVVRLLHVGLLCTQEIPTLRPSMPKALQMLVKKDEELPPPTKPPFVGEKTMELHDPWEKYSPKQGNSATIANLSNSSFYPR